MYSENNFLLDCSDLTLYSNYSSFVKIYVKVMLQLQTSCSKYHFLGYSITCSYLRYHGTIYFFFPLQRMDIYCFLITNLVRSYLHYRHVRLNLLTVP
jgi:hypothetical protein